MASNGDDFTARLMDDMDPVLLDFVKTKVNSFVKWDLVRFFHENPHTADTVENIAKYAGRNVAAVEPELTSWLMAESCKKPRWAIRRYTHWYQMRKCATW